MNRIPSRSDVSAAQRHVDSLRAEMAEFVDALDRRDLEADPANGEKAVLDALADLRLNFVNNAAPAVLELFGAEERRRLDPARSFGWAYSLGVAPPDLRTVEDVLTAEAKAALHGKRIAYVCYSTEVFAPMLMQGTKTRAVFVTRGLPDGAVRDTTVYDQASESFWCVFVHESFPVYDGTTPIPQVEIVFEDAG